MAVTSFDPRNPKYQGAPGRVGEILHGYKEAGSQSFKAGQFVYLNSGAVTVSADGDVPVMGIALADATNTSSASALIEIPVQIIGPEDRVLIQVSTGGTLEAANTTCKPGIGYDLETVSTNLHYIDSADTTNMKFVFVRPIKDSAGSVTYWGEFAPIYLENQVTAE